MRLSRADATANLRGDCGVLFHADPDYVLFIIPKVLSVPAVHDREGLTYVLRPVFDVVTVGTENVDPAGPEQFERAPSRPPIREEPGVGLHNDSVFQKRFPDVGALIVDIAFYVGQHHRNTVSSVKIEYLGHH